MRKGFFYAIFLPCLIFGSLFSYNGWHPESSANTYEVSGNKIIFYDSVDEDEIETCTVLSFKNNIVVLEATLEEGPQYKQRITCKRVN